MLVVITARGGSKEIPKKNLSKVGGLTLVERSIRCALNANCVERIIVSTDDHEIGQLSSTAGAEVYERPAELSGDEIMPDHAVVHVLQTIVNSGESLPSVTCFVQPTSPFTNSEDLDKAYELFKSNKCDSMLSATASHYFLWEITEKTYVKPTNHNSSVRVGRQNLKQQFVESGNFYLFRSDKFIETKHRFFGNIGLYPIPKVRAIDIDNFDDLNIAKSIHSSGLHK